MKQKYKQYNRVGIYDLEDVLPYVISVKITRYLRRRGVRKNSPEWKNRTERKYDGYSVRMSSGRYRMFKAKGTTCITCGFKGAYFALENHKKSGHDKYHFNCYGKDENGNERMITKDHIIPRSLGGPNHLYNYQPMCDNCNAAKQDGYYTKDPVSILDDVDRLLHGVPIDLGGPGAKHHLPYRLASYLLRIESL